MRTHCCSLLSAFCWLLIVTPCIGVSQVAPTTSQATAARNPALRADLLHRMAVDQSVRRRFLEWMQQNHRADVQALKSQDFPIAQQMRAIDRDNTERMKRIVDRYGWLGKSLVGDDGANKEKFILDTDIGDDIDDAYALALLASWPEAELLGVTTTFGPTHERAVLAAKLLSVMGRSDVPVFAGRRGASPVRRQCDWARGFHGSNLDPGDAVAFLKREIDRYPGKITLIGIGPLVNLGDLLTRYPEEKPRIKRIVIMGGAVFVGYNNQAPPTPEWNIRCDPAAARVVFSSGVPLVMAGLEVTTMMQFDAERQKRLFAYGTPLTDALAALTNLWGGNTPTLYDVVAVGYALGHGFCEEEPHHVEVDDNGMTRITDGPPNVTVLVHPHKEAFLDWYIASLAPLVP